MSGRRVEIMEHCASEISPWCRAILDQDGEALRAWMESEWDGTMADFSMDALAELGPEHLYFCLMVIGWREMVRFFEWAGTYDEHERRPEREQEPEQEPEQEREIYAWRELTWWRRHFDHIGLHDAADVIDDATQPVCNLIRAKKMRALNALIIDRIRLDLLAPNRTTCYEEHLDDAALVWLINTFSYATVCATYAAAEELYPFRWSDNEWREPVVWSHYEDHIV